MQHPGLIHIIRNSIVFMNVQEAQHIMVEPSGHCPYLGLKQNRAIRFAAPTPEHRCYVGGEPIEIPVDQASYCLSRGHVQCPLYMGLSVPSITDTGATPALGMGLIPPAGLRGWFSTLPPRDRAIYAIMLGMLAVIIVIYLIAGLQSFTTPPNGPFAVGSTPVPTTALARASVLPSPSPVPAISVPPTPTNLPTSTPQPAPTLEPTRAPLMLSPTFVLPTAVATTAPTVAPASTQVPQPSPTPRTGSTVPTVTPPPRATSVAPTPQPTQAPTAVPATTEVLWLYFADQTGSLFVPVQRRAPVEDRQVARAAIRELIAGPRNGLQRLVVPDVQLLGLTIDSGTATVNFDRRPTGAGDDRGLQAIVLTLTHFESITRVQFQVNGQNIGINGSGPLSRPIVNPINPDGLPVDYRQTEFLPIYFLAQDGSHYIRLIRMVPKTRQVAEGTIRALLEGPGSYAYAVQRIIPAGTQLRGISLENGIVSVDFTQPFADAANRDAAARSVAYSLTTISNIRGVRLLVEGRSLAEWWGESYGGVFERQLVNAE